MLREGSAALSPPSPVFTVVPTEIQGAFTSPAGNRRMPFELFFRRLQLGPPFGRISRAIRTNDGNGMAGTTGFEPATSDVTGRRSNQTELRPRSEENPSE